MALPAPVIRSFRDIQMNFESLVKGALTFVDRVARTFSMGSATLAFVANNDASVTVPHGLPRTPTRVFVSARQAGTSSIAMPGWGATATDITFDARTYNGASATFNVTLDWLAVL